MTKKRKNGVKNDKEKWKNGIKNGKNEMRNVTLNAIHSHTHHYLRRFFSGKV